MIVATGRKALLRKMVAALPRPKLPKNRRAAA